MNFHCECDAIVAWVKDNVQINAQATGIPFDNEAIRSAEGKVDASHSGTSLKMRCIGACYRIVIACD